MKSNVTGSHTYSSEPLLIQSRMNSCTWIGHTAADPDDHFAGQTFTSPRSGLLDTIEVYFSEVQSAGRVLMSLHAFDPDRQTWGPALAMGECTVNPSLRESWVRFHLDPVHMEEGKMYGFRMAALDVLVALAEAVEDHQHPFTYGQEWNADSAHREGRYYSYFSLAFRMGMRA